MRTSFLVKSLKKLVSGIECVEIDYHDFVLSYFVLAL